jgi:hypothetical protein
MVYAENANLTNEDQITSIDEPENRWNLHFVSYDTLTSSGNPSSQDKLSHWVWNLGIFDESHWYKTKHSVGGRTVTNVRIGFKLQVTAMPGLHSLYDWCYLTMWRFSGGPEDPKDKTVMEMHCADELYSAVKSLMDAI